MVVLRSRRTGEDLRNHPLAKPREVMHVRDFGDVLIRTQDLDPVYTAIHGARLPEPQLCRLLLAYWMFYHLGSAAWLSEQEGAAFWDWVAVAAVNAPSISHCPPLGPDARWPRAAERRHFRGQKCVDAVKFFAREQPEHWVRWVSRFAPQGAVEVMAVVQLWPQFGPWIAFKAADMLERVAYVPVKFPQETGLMYSEPSAALDMLAQGSPHGREWWWHRLLTYFSARRAPPAMDRHCGPQEVETVLCKWKSHHAGHYWVGKDTHEVRDALGGWGDTASRLLRHLPAADEAVH